MQRLVLLFLGWAIACANLLAQSTGTVSGTVKVMGAKNSADVVVYVESVNGPMTVEPPAQPAVIDQRQKVFIPHVLPIVKGTAVTFLNSDDLLHNVHARQDRRSLFNVGMPFKDYKITRKFAKPGEVVLLCDVHAEMSAYLIVLETPYFSISREFFPYTPSR